MTLKTLNSQLHVFEEIDCNITEEDPDFADANEVLRWKAGR